MDELRPGVGPERVTNGDSSGSASACVPDQQRPHHPARRGAGRAVRLLLGATLLATGWVMLTALSSQAAETQHGRTLGGLTRALGPVSNPVRQVLGAADAATAGRSQHPAGRAAATRSTSHTTSAPARHPGRPLRALVADGLPLADSLTSTLPLRQLLPVPVDQRTLPLRTALSTLLSAAGPLPLLSPVPVAAPVASAVPFAAASLPVEGPVLGQGTSALSAPSAGWHAPAGLRWPGRPGPIPTPEPFGLAGAVTFAGAGAAGWAAVALGGLGLGARGPARRITPADHRLPVSPAPRPGIRPA